MTFPYLLRLASLCTACFFLVHSVLALLVRVLSPRIIRFADRATPRAGVRLLLAFRLLPAILSTLVVLGLCAPSYLWLEPARTDERVGLVFLVAAVFGAAILGHSIVRAFFALSGSCRFTRQCLRVGSSGGRAAHACPLIVVERDSGLLVTAGLLHPRIIVSRKVLETLSPEQIDAALRHERAHYSSRDNFKRFLLLLAPEVFPFCRALASLDRAWSRLAEWAADDRARHGDALRSVSLASALVSVARLGSSPQLSPIVTSLVPWDQDLSTRVNRLLSDPPVYEASSRRLNAGLGNALLLGTALVLTGLFAAAALHPATFHAVHELLERFTH